MKKLTGKVALVTGAGRGIGQQIAIQLAAEGASVVINDLDEAAALETAAAIQSMGGESIICCGSVIDSGFPARLIDSALSRWGDLHILINNAGYTWDSTIHKMGEDQFDAMIDVHLKAPWRILKAAADFIRTKSRQEREQGIDVYRKVVNISSTTGTRGNAGQTNYSAAKAGILGLTKSLAKEWGRYNVNVNAVAFGFIETRLTAATDEKCEIDVDGKKVSIGVPKNDISALTAMIPMGRAGTPTEAAGAVVMLCYPEANYVSGQILEVTGGW